MDAETQPPQQILLAQDEQPAPTSSPPRAQPVKRQRELSAYAIPVPPRLPPPAKNGMTTPPSAPAPKPASAPKLPPRKRRVVEETDSDDYESGSDDDSSEVYTDDDDDDDDDDETDDESTDESEPVPVRRPARPAAKARQPADLTHLSKPKLGMMHEVLIGWGLKLLGQHVASFSLNHSVNSSAPHFFELQFRLASALSGNVATLRISGEGCTENMNVYVDGMCYGYAKTDKAWAAAYDYIAKKIDEQCGALPFIFFVLHLMLVDKEGRVAPDVYRILRRQILDNTSLYAKCIATYDPEKMETK